MLSSKILFPSLPLSGRLKAKLPSARALRKLLPLLAVLLIVLAACSPDDPVPDTVCNFYVRSVFTIRLIGGFSLIVGLALIGLRKNLAAVMPSQGFQMGAAAISLLIGVVLLSLTTEIGGQVLAGLGLPDIVTLCPIA